jgi:AcrR family transcriptional regulator
MPRRKVQPDITQAAIKLFGLCTFKGVTTRALAKEARVQEPALYAWFPNKESMYLQAVNAVIAQMNQEFTKFMFTMFSGSEEPTPARVIEALRTWCASIPGPNARLLVQVLVSDDKHSNIAREPLNQIVNTLARTLEPQKKANRKFNPQTAAKTLVRALLWGKVIENKAADHDIDEVLKQFLLSLPA